ncbi:hypothetical protein GJAV_G00071510 [Gymnothorax javanicus]|nr:hypothetical protein GJAV_G00071510 [Gymnothorax javanicus]
MIKTISVITLAGFFFGINSVTAVELKFIPDPLWLNIEDKVLRINATDSLELRCSGWQKLYWTTPSNRSLAEGRVSLSDCSGNGLFCSALNLTKATANETGEYRCSYRDLPVEDRKTSAAVYIYVQDYKSPFVRSSQNYDVVFIREGQQVVIPCLGSVEDLNVTLYTEYPRRELILDGLAVQWDSRRGFIVPSHLISYASLAFCQTRILNHTFQSSRYIIAVVGYKINDLSVSPAHQRLTVGERLELNCTAHTELNVGLDFQWIYPQSRVKWNISETRFYKRKLWDSLVLSSSLILENVSLSDTGDYICSASSGQMTKSSRATLVVYEKPFIILNKQTLWIVEATVGDGMVKIPVKYYAYPLPEVKWLKNGEPVKEQRYRVKPGKEALIIYDVLERDAANYTVLLRNPATKEQLRRSFQLLVNVPPQIFEKEVVQDADAHVFGSSPTLRCTARGSPTPIAVQWQWMPLEDCPLNFLSGGWRADALQQECTDWRDISNNTGQNPIESLSTHTDHSHKTVSSLKIQKAQVHALYRCVASNKVGRDERVIFFHVTRGLALSLWPSAHPLEQGSVVLQCNADKLIYSNLRWFWLGADQWAWGPGHFLPVQPCRGLALPANPLPQAVLTNQGGPNITLDLPLSNLTRADQGLYVCQVENLQTRERTCLLHRLELQALQPARILVNLTEQTVNVSDTTALVCDVTGTPTPTILWTKDNKTLQEGSGVVLSRGNRTLTVQRVKKEDSGLYRCLACNRLACVATSAQIHVEGAEKKTNVELIVPIGSVVIAMFLWLIIVFVIRSRKRPLDGELKPGYLSIMVDSDDLPMDEHCERLTYDPNKWEFPRDRLKLGEPLGRGAFGQVVEAAAFGIEKATTCTTVAVKMLKEGATSSEYRALMSELKILIHIGHHLNVVNLLGACTKPGGPLMVIVEYCKHGNLSTYLKSQRAAYAPFKRRPRREEDLQEGNLGLGATSQLDSPHLDSPSLQPHEDEATDSATLTMEDLISYSFQVAKGMEFLSSRKCIHRDLAARNILLSENNARLPLKWMAPETIFDRVYTTQSDVWSFGVLLWEIFSLGASPYPGVGIDESFCRRLKEGTRMRAPEYASPEIYQTMLECWLDRPTDRPTFAELVEHLGNLLQANALQDGKDYIPVTTIEEGRGLSSKRSIGGPDRQRHYDNAPPLRFPQSEGSSRIGSEEAFDGRVEHNVAMDGQTDSGVDPSASQSPNCSPLLLYKSQESLASESSNQTSGYQSGYHSDDADAPLYANEEVILKKTVFKSAVKKNADKYTTEVRYSAPPV